MARTAYAVAALLVLCATSWAGSDFSVALLEPVSNTYVDAPVPCGAGELCMDGWYRWDMKLARMIRGPNLPKRFKAVILQHTDAKIDRNIRALGVLVPIPDAETRKKLGAEYYLRELSLPWVQYCLLEPPANYGIPLTDGDSVSQPQPNGRYCFNQWALQP